MKSLFAAFAALLTVAAGATQYSKLALITAAKAAGRWDAAKAWISANGYADEFAACSYISDDFPGFDGLIASVVAAGVATQEEVAAILAASHDTSLPDSLMIARYQRDMATETGRREWHGPSETHIDTNRLVRVYTYADGYVHETPWTPPKPKIQLELEQARKMAGRLNARAEKMAPAAAEALRARAAAILAEAEAKAAGGQVETVEIGPGAQSGPRGMEAN